MPTATARTLEINGLRLGYGETVIIPDLSLAVPTGKVTALIGPNGCGKSTLLRGIARLLKPANGTISVDGRPVSSYGGKEFARMVGLLPQIPVTPEGITVADLVARGRYPYQGLFRGANRDDDAAVARALEATNTLELADRQVTELSGGQRQRVWIALALAQETDVLLLDEPTTYLDLAHQVELLDLLATINEERGTTMVMVLHELNLAARIAHHLVAMKDGRIAASGSAEQVLTSAHLEEIFGLQAEVADPLADGSIVVVPRARATARAMSELATDAGV
ncbi:ABC transporter ATP-binding protein [Rothia nasisuis]|uniref:ABC transporter ATP-binding protein n=1 Tax=Rothia nasisuis TaxID=2109647 RepID=UPI001F25B363|nr:ABC transporter ATP-binding protein [Rothia nasisuis]